MSMGKATGPAEAGPVPVHRTLKGRDVRSDFHGHGNDFSFGLGPGHVNTLEKEAEKYVGQTTQSVHRFFRR